MAATAVERFRRITGIPDEYVSDLELPQLLAENADDINVVASIVWERKANELAELVDVSESGSSRSLGTLYKNALAMAEMYRSRTEAGASEGPYASRTREAVRG